MTKNGKSKKSIVKGEADKAEPIVKAEISKRICAICGKAFIPGRWTQNTQRYCDNPECKKAGKAAALKARRAGTVPTTVECPVCHNQWEPRPGHIWESAGHACPSCRKVRQANVAEAPR